MTASATQNLFDLIKHGGLTEEALALVSQLSNAGLVSLQDPIATKLGPKPFSKALLSLVDPGVVAPYFYTPAAARQLLALDPEFFCQRANAFDHLWLEYNVCGWARREDRKALAAGSELDNPVNQWAEVVFSSLSAHEKQGEALFSAALKLGLSRGAEVLIAHRPGGWAQTYDNGKPLIALVVGAWAWEKALTAGIDPYAPTSSGKPFWRAMLPDRSSIPSESGSGREAVEQWVVQEIKKPGSPPDLMEYMRTAAFCRATSAPSSNAWNALSQEARLAYVSKLPEQWVNWSRRSESVPFWMELAVGWGVTVSGWLETMAQNPLWIAQIQQDPVSHFAFEILKAQPDLPVGLNEIVDCPAAFADPRYKEVLVKLATLLAVAPNLVESWVSALDLQVKTVSSPTATRVSRRL